MNFAPDSKAIAPRQPLTNNARHLSQVGKLHASSIPLSTLFGIIFKQILPLFSVECGAILMYDEHLTTMSEAYLSTYNISSDQIEPLVITNPTVLSPLQRTIAGLPFPVLKSMDDWIAEENVNHQVIQSDIQYKYHGYIPIEASNKILGTLELHSNARPLSTECLTFTSNIADLLAEIINVNQSFSSLTNDIEINAQLDEIAILKAKLDEERMHVSDPNEASDNFPEIIGDGIAINKVFTQMNQVSGTDSTVLILGETGTGKELIARAIHERSTRKDHHMIAVNCAAIPANLIESELFGHEKGAFTGAMELRIGKFELANNSTIFLDEVGELPLELQVKLLRVVQEQEIERVGGKSTIKINVRIISATNRNLLTEVEKGRFRQDLYYRLHIFPISLPPLRERIEDIPQLASHFLSKYGKQKTGFTRRAINQMTNYNWPGNVRELEHLIERQVILNANPVISEMSIPKTVLVVSDDDGIPKSIKTIDENERDHIFSVLQICRGRISGEGGAAKLLGVPATTLNSKIKRLGLNKQHF